MTCVVFAVEIPWPVLSCVFRSNICEFNTNMLGIFLYIFLLVFIDFLLYDLFSFWSMITFSSQILAAIANNSGYF